jgi:hypothetical protein
LISNQASLHPAGQQDVNLTFGSRKTEQRGTMNAAAVGVAPRCPF